MAASDDTLYLYTSLTAGSSHIITATSRLETILKANKIPFRAVDVATDEKARMLWGRRSKGRKLPGLVKFGTIVGDIEQIEEWNEYGELKEQIAGADEFGTLGASTLGANLTPGPTATTAAADTTTSTPQRSGPPSRASSETRHISITEPNKDKEKDTGSQKTTDSPGNQILRQLGAEAAAKAAQKKTAATSAAKAPAKVPSTSEATPTAAATKLSADAAVESSNTVTEATAAKTPIQLATEGAKRTSIDKIAESEPTATSPTSPSATQAESGEAASTEAQVLETRRTSSITKIKSRLSETTQAGESDTVFSDKGSKSAVEESEVSPTVPPAARKHRGSDIGEATPEEIRALEKKLSILEEDEDDDDEGEDEDHDDDDDDEKVKDAKPAVVSSTDKAEAEATKSADVEKGDPKDASKAGVSVGD
ncbi:uncharacterized protein A1O9_05604 [Exophiala aquamarina CBS 119918]|uniref:Uncharacterized protein n=1 Tax=Exophiala aquamarina CBS 119918 TaxID=1182545 RepID=A0A072PCW9_9EURO|nr:uncharacterized protein A1O9_05604 [Exophiala aquamarina CBS 119918]KEF57686.1 hypothetical protein A1O9_05604 [Exophiala aquamarina CBS 119918]